MFQIDTGDDGIHADTLLVLGTQTALTGPQITISNSYEGLEATHIYVYSGTYSIVSSDDGVNAASDDRTVTPTIYICGGSMEVNAGGDGLDSNGNIYMTDGTVEEIGRAHV